MKNLVHLEDVGKTFEVKGGHKVVAVEGVSIDVAENEFVTIVGPSGCGKSTILKLVVGLIPPTTGKILIDGEQVKGPYKDVGMVFQSSVLLPWRTVIQNVLLPIEILKLKDKDYLAITKELLELVGLKGFEDKKPRHLSGGMQQRVSICRALIYEPRLLLMDEPFGALDAMTREEMGFELLRIWEEKTKTILFVTHSIPEAVFLADRVVVMTARPGKIAKLIKVNLPRPRSSDMEFTEQFKEYVNSIKEAIYFKAA